MLRAWTRITAHALGRLGRTDEALAAGIAADFAERRWERMTLFPGVTAALEPCAPAASRSPWSPTGTPAISGARSTGTIWSGSST